MRESKANPWGLSHGRLQNSRSFFSKSVKCSFIRVSHAWNARASHARLSLRFQFRSRPLFDFPCVLEYAKNRLFFSLVTQATILHAWAQGKLARGKTKRERRANAIVLYQTHSLKCVNQLDNNNLVNKVTCQVFLLMLFLLLCNSPQKSSPFAFSSTFL